MNNRNETEFINKVFDEEPREMAKEERRHTQQAQRG